MSILYISNIARIKCYSSRYGNYIYFNQKPINYFKQIKYKSNKNILSKTKIINTKNHSDNSNNSDDSNQFFPFLL